jgi:hypothetical protein
MIDKRGSISKGNMCNNSENIDKGACNISVCKLSDKYVQNSGKVNMRGTDIVRKLRYNLCGKVDIDK